MYLYVLSFFLLRARSHRFHCLKHERFVCVAGTINTLKSRNTDETTGERNEPSAMYIHSKTFLKPSEFLSILFHFGSKLKPTHRHTDKLSKAAILWVGERACAQLSLTYSHSLTLSLRVLWIKLSGLFAAVGSALTLAWPCFTDFNSLLGIRNQQQQQQQQQEQEAMAMSLTHRSRPGLAPGRCFRFVHVKVK